MPKGYLCLLPETKDLNSDRPADQMSAEDTLELDEL